MSTDIESNFALVNERIENACARCGRERKSVTLVTVTKFVDTERIAEAIGAGATDVGENRVQDLKDKLTFFELHGVHTHLIGQLQTNKVKYVCNQVGLIQSVDRRELVDKLEQQAAKNGAVQDILLQVNIGDEPQKGGIPVCDLEDLFAYAANAAHLCVRGLMCVPPAVEGELVRPYFQKMYGLFNTLKAAYPSLCIDTLSMGMSHDFELAIEEGATMVRVGTAIFGPRIRP